VLDSLSDGSPVSVPYSLVSQWTSGFKNETHRGSLNSYYSGLVLPLEGFADGQGRMEGRRVTVKKTSVTTDGLEDRAEVLQLSEGEIGILSRLRHVNIIGLMAYCSSPTDMLWTSPQCMREVYLVYEFAPLGDLNTHLTDSVRAEKLKWHSRLRIALGVAKGLCCMHCSETDSPAYHRDIKSSNILLMADYTPKIDGCGLSNCMPLSSVSDLSIHSDSSTRLGTVEYMCPHYGVGEIVVYDAKCDVYSFGIVLLELLTGQLQGNINKEGKQVMLNTLLLEVGTLLADDRVQWPCDLVDDILALARECVAPYQRRIGSMMTVLHGLEAMTNKHSTLSTTELSLLEENDHLLGRLAALELQEDIKAMRAIEDTHRCMGCFDCDVPVSKGITCSNLMHPHFFCGSGRNDCVSKLLSSQSNDITHLRKESPDIPCACCTALTPKEVCTFDVSVVARQASKEAFAAYMRAVVSLERHETALAEEKLRSHYFLEMKRLSKAHMKGIVSGKEAH
jgi:serine/threonine protein kinase